MSAWPVAGCAPSASAPSDPKAYTMSLEEVWERAGDGWSEAVTEFHIVGGLHPELTLDWYCQMLRGLKAALSAGAPEGLHHGRDRLPGAAARKSACAKRSNACATPAWIRCPAAAPKSSASASAASSATTKSTGDAVARNVARTAHQLGLHSNCTMLYGHIENEEDRVDHLVSLRALAGRDPRLRHLHPAGVSSRQHAARSTFRRPPGFDDIRNIAVSRLMLDNIPHIKAYWVMMTPRIAQIAQRFGADDIDGTIVEERIYHDAGATTVQGLRRAELLRLIRKAGREPIERDTLYRPVERTENAFTVLV